MTTYYPVKDQDQDQSYVSLRTLDVGSVRRVRFCRTRWQCKRQPTHLRAPVINSPDRVEHIAVVCAESVLADPLSFAHGDVWQRGRKRSFDKVDGHMELPSCDNKRPRLGSFSEE